MCCSDPPDHVEVAQQMWEAIANNTCKPLKFSHNTYLKQFSDALVDRHGILRNWRGQPYQVILMDEAQDINKVTLQMLLSQPCLRVLVGDRHQHIYSFNFCANALEGAAAAAAAAGRPSRVRSYSLSSSFRLGFAVAAVANK
jgi:F-box protein 18 (helicase)